MKRKRDYEAEYRRRIKRALARGLSRSQARGHAKAHEASVRPAKSINSDSRLEAALKALRETGSQAKAAKLAGIAPERLRRFTTSNALAKREGKSWRITDNRNRRMTVISGGSLQQTIMSGFDQASRNARHLNAIRRFLGSNDIEMLRPFEGQGVIDINGVNHLFETDPNTLHRLAAMGSELFHDVYRLIQ